MESTEEEWKEEEKEGKKRKGEIRTKLGVRKRRWKRREKKERVVRR